MKKTLKIIGIILGIIVLIIVSSILYEILYQETRKNHAGKIFSKYLETHYTDLEYECTNLRFNIKDDYVYMTIDVKDSEDKDFNISVNEKGEVMSDYEWVINQKSEILTRFQVYLNEKTWKEPVKELFGENYRFEHLTPNENYWYSHQPEFDILIEDLLEAYPIECIVYVEGVDIYDKDELIDLKKEVKKIYKELGIELDKIEIY